MNRISVFLFLLMFAEIIVVGQAYASDLSCRMAPECSDEEACIIAFENSTGGTFSAHAQTCDIATYHWNICCKNVQSTVASSCSVGVISLENSSGGRSNAHVSDFATGTYANSVCVTGQNVTCETRLSCDYNQICLFELQNGLLSKTNAHVAECGSGFRWSVCCGGVGTGPHCGDSDCEEGEESTCPEDCNQSQCGNGDCEAYESVTSCPADCSESQCGNNECEAGETILNCPADCGGAICGDRKCEAGETTLNCPEDCATAVCGNSRCDAGETTLNCPEDCAEAVCGNSRCDAGETTINCPEDCVSGRPERDPIVEETNTTEPETDEPKSTWKYLFYWPLLLILLLAVIIGVYFIKKKKPKKGLDTLAQKYDIDKPSQYLNKLTTYIQNSTRQGYSRDEIESQLTQLGWKKTQINNAFTQSSLLTNYHQINRNKVEPRTVKKSLAKKFQIKQINQAFSHYSAHLGQNPTAVQKKEHLNQIAKNFDLEPAGKLSGLVSYIRKCYNLGYNKDMIVKILKQYKWPDNQINEAFTKAE